jgi:hypothetical protein
MIEMKNSIENINHDFIMLKKELRNFKTAHLKLANLRNRLKKHKTFVMVYHSI